MRHFANGPVWALLVAAALALGAVPAAQETQAVVRLQQEVDSLEYRLDFEVQQLRRSVEQLQAQLSAAEARQRTIAPVPAVAAVPTPVVPAAPGVTGVTGDEASPVSSRRFVVQDAEGRPRAVATVSDRFGPMLALLDVRGDVGLMLSSPATGPRVELFDDRLQLRLSARLEGDEPVVELLGVDGASLGRLQLRNGRAVLDLNERDR